MYDTISKIKFRHYNNDFQEQIKKDIRDIKTCTNVLVCADKTSNIYKVTAQDYKNLITKEIHKGYKKAPPGTVDDINKEAANIIKQNNITGKIPKYEKREAFITLKDHKVNFATDTKCRLINPSKTHLGKVAKAILDNINSTVRTNSNLVQWKNTQAVISWFDDIPNKSQKCFVKFDIIDFYPFITSEVIKRALEFAGSFVNISESDFNIILHSSKTILFYNEEVWIKRTSDDLFDVPMGSFHGAELCDLIGLFILHNIHDCLPVGLYGL